jgi:hypothetical protein
VYDLDLLSMAVLTNSANGSTTTGNNTGDKDNKQSNVSSPPPIGDESWYPVPVQNACDYYEQLEQILPTQYEILLKQIIRKYKLNEPVSTTTSLGVDSPPIAITATASTIKKPNMMKMSSSCYSLSNVNTNDYLHKVLSNNNNNGYSDGVIEPCGNAAGSVWLNWKNVWDYFYQLAEAKIVKDLSAEIRDDSSVAAMMHQQMSNGEQQQQLTYSIIKPYLSSLPPATSTMKRQQLQQPTIKSLQSQSSSSQCSQVSATPPFPKVRETTTLTQLSAHAVSAKYLHEFQTALFSSVNVCKLCNTSFKSSKIKIKFQQSN